MAATGAKGKVLLRNLNDLSQIPQTLSLFDCEPQAYCMVWSVAFSPDGQTLAASGVDGTFTLWSNREAKWQEAFRFAGEGEDKSDLTSLDFHPQEPIIAIANKEGKIYFWDIQNPTKAQKIDEILTEQDQLWDISFGPDGEQLASAGEDGTVRLWDLNTEQSESHETIKLTGHKAPVRSVILTEDYAAGTAKRQIISAGDDGSIRLWNIEGNESQLSNLSTQLVEPEIELESGSHKARGNLDGTIQWFNPGKIEIKGNHVSAVTSLAFNPDSKQLASGGKDRTIRLWNQQGELERLLSVSAPVTSVAYSSDGNLLAGAVGDGTVQLWNLKSLEEGRPFAAWKAYSGAVEQVRFGSEDQVLITVGEDNQKRIRKEWQIDSFNSLLEQAEDKIQRDLLNRSHMK